MNVTKPVFSHQRLDVYRVALDAAKWIHKASISPTSLREQARRAIDSVVLNIAEGADQRSPAMARKHYRIALGSAAEVAAAFDLIALRCTRPLAEPTLLINRVGMMLRRLAR